MSVTIKDVARFAGVDASAVSRVLSQSMKNHKYSPATIQKIQFAAKALDYKPSKTAQALRTGKSMLIGIVVPEISNPFFSELVSHIELLAWESGYCTIISNTNEDPKRQEKQIEDLILRGIDSLIIAPTLGSKLNEFKRLVTVDRPLEKSNIPYVGLDNYLAGWMLGEKLAELGYKRIGVIMPDIKYDPTPKRRLEGLLAGMGNSECLEWLLEKFSHYDDIRVQVIKKLKCENLPDAIIGLTNWCTLGALQALMELEISWGNEIGLAGVDDLLTFKLLKPAITIVAQPIQQIAQKAFELLINQMDDSKRNSINTAYLLSPIWKERNSLPLR